MNLRETLETPVKEQCGVLVAGGGIAGISAALSAARAGANVILAEREFLLGGLATAGLVNCYLPLDDGMGRQLSFGLAEELLRLALDADDGPEKRQKLALWLEPHSPEERAAGGRFDLIFDPWVYAMACERLLLRENVRILYGAQLCGIAQENGRVSAVIAEGKEGRFALACRSLVDATGDADLLIKAEAPTACDTDGNLLAAWYGFYDGANPPDVKVLGFCDSLQDPENNPLLRGRFFGCDTATLSRMTCQSHEQIYEDVRRQRQANAAYRLAYMPVIPQIRMTRRLTGSFELDVSDDHRDFADSIGLMGSWRARGPAYAIPLRAIQAESHRNLFTAGRTIAATQAMWDLTRVIPACAVTGEAAGLAAALVAQDSFAPTILRAALRKRCIPLSLREAGLTE